MEPEIKVTTINWRIYNFIRAGILSRIGMGKFKISMTKIYIPELSKRIKLLDTVLKRQFPFTGFCLWQSSLFNEFMVHQPGKFFILIEAERDSLESVFYFLKDKKFTAFLEPTEDIIDKYFPEDKEPIVIKKLVSEAPIQIRNGISTTTIEKLLVDVFCDTTIFSAQQGPELINIYKSAFSKYTINENRMLRYANRRQKKESLNIFMDSVFKFRQ